jgi:hypothetical protein
LLFQAVQCVVKLLDRSGGPGGVNRNEILYIGQLLLLLRLSHFLGPDNLKGLMDLIHGGEEQRLDLAGQFLGLEHLAHNPYFQGERVDVLAVPIPASGLEAAHPVANLLHPAVRAPAYVLAYLVPVILSLQEPRPVVPVKPQVGR